MKAIAAMDDEFIDVYDERERPLGSFSRKKVHQDGLWHRSFHCWIVFRLDDSRKYMVFQRRGSMKATWPNFLDISAAGHYKAGEKIEGGIREINEELGVKVDANQLCKIGTRIIDEHLPNGELNREFQDIFFLNSRYSLSDYKPTFPELNGVYHLLINDIRGLLVNRLSMITAKGITLEISPPTPTQTQLIATLNDFIPNALHYLRLVTEVAESFLSDNQCGRDLESSKRLADGSFWKPEIKGQYHSE